MKTLEANGVTYKVITSEREALGDFNDGELFVEIYIAAANMSIWRLSRRVEFAGYDDDFTPLYEHGEWSINKLCEIEDLK